MTFSAVIYSPGRTGSHIILGDLARHYNITMPQRELIHTHNPLFKPINNNFTCVLSKRRNIFDAIMSTITSRYTLEFTSYSNRKIDPFFVSELQFQKTCVEFKTFFKLIDATKFKDVIEIYYEDMIADPKYLFSRFGIDAVTTFRAPTWMIEECETFEKSPYNYQKLVQNIDDLRKQYVRLTDLPLTRETLQEGKDIFMKRFPNG